MQVVSDRVSPAPAEAYPTTSGRFIVHCSPTARAALDPILFPGKSGLSHSHDFFGPLAVPRYATPATLAREPSSCSSPADHSTYWFPTLSEQGSAVRPERMQAYYTVNDLTQPFPDGLAYITSTASASNHLYWSCAGKGGEHPTPSATSCTEDQYLYATAQFPSCWDGVHTDISDHQSHMAYASPLRTCPATHPVHIPQLTLFLQWSCNVLCGPTRDLTLSSGPTSGLHVDFLSGWDERALRQIIARCQDRDCGVLGSGNIK